MYFDVRTALVKSGQKPTFKKKAKLKTQKKTAKQSVRAILIAVILIAAALFLLFRDGRPSLPAPLPHQTSLQNAVKTEVLASYSFDEMKQFWALHCKETFEDQLIGGTFPIQEIQARYNTNFSAIQKRYGKVYRVAQSTNYCEASKNVLAGAGLINSDPVLTVFVPSMMNVYFELRNKTNREALFRNLLAVSVIHEMDHLAYDVNNREQTGELLPLEELVQSEKKIWGLTCEYALRPLIEVHGETLAGGDRSYYEAWVKFGRTSDSKDWENFIRSTYAETRR